MPLPPARQPIRLHPHDVPRPWGGGKFAAPGATPIGERWLYSLLAGQVSQVCGGGHEGLPLEAERVGFALPPLLVKLIDTASALSVQVHPDDAMARRLGWPNGKSEMWYILSARPESYILLGLRAAMEAATIAEAARSGRLPGQLHRIQPRPGACYHVPAGQIHALGPGLQLLEIQQAADITYRLYDWGRVDAAGRSRPLDLEHALEACSKLPYAPADVGQVGEGQRVLVEDPHFRVELHASALGAGVVLPARASAYVLVGVQGMGCFTWPYDGSRWCLGAEELLLMPPHGRAIAADGEAGLTWLTAQGA